MTRNYEEKWQKEHSDWYQRYEAAEAALLAEAPGLTPNTIKKHMIPLLMKAHGALAEHVGMLEGSQWGIEHLKREVEQLNEMMRKPRYKKPRTSA